MPPPPALEDQLTDALSAAAARSETCALSFGFACPSRQWRWHWTAPGVPAQHFIASATKLYTATLALQLVDEGRVFLDAPAADYLGTEALRGMHVIDGVDHAPRITVGQLLSHTSGLADYFEDARRGSPSLRQQILRNDLGWSLEDIRQAHRVELRPYFAPGARRAHYSDTNYQLLGAVIEAVTGQSYEECLRRRIIEPLALSDTFLFTSSRADRYRSVAPVFDGRRQLHIPRAMASMGPDGGLVSTVVDGLRFMEALMSARLISQGALRMMQSQWRRVFFPFEYGLGLMRFAPSRWISLFRRVPPMVGHVGASGSLMFNVPELNLYAAGTVNQVRGVRTVIGLMVRSTRLIARHCGS
jgi:D-alanyl-D-alanine carboxypeptidase